MRDFEKTQAAVALVRFAERIDDSARWREVGVLTEFEFELYVRLALARLEKRLGEVMGPMSSGSDTGDEPCAARP